MLTPPLLPARRSSITRRRRVPTAPSLHGPYSCRLCLRDQPECHMMLYARATIADESLTSFFSPPHLIFFSLPISSPPSSCTSSSKENRRRLTAPGGLAAQRWSSWIQPARPRQRSAAPAPRSGGSRRGHRPQDGCGACRPALPARRRCSQVPPAQLRRRLAAPNRTTELATVACGRRWCLSKALEVTGHSTSFKFLGIHWVYWFI